MNKFNVWNAFYPLLSSWSYTLIRIIKTVGYLNKLLEDAICKYEMFLYHYYLSNCEVENLKVWEWVDLKLHFFSVLSSGNLGCDKYEREAI